MILPRMLLLVLVGLVDGDPENGESQTGSHGFVRGERRVGVAYHWAYRYPDEGFQDERALDGDPLRYHFRDARRVSPLSTAWHREQFEAMASCGIDFVVPQPAADPAHFVARVLPHFVEALSLAGEEEKPTPLVALRVDPSLLVDVDGLRQAARELVDLANPWGRQRVHGVVHSFFAAIPKRFWATIDGRPLVIFDAATRLKGYDADLFEYLRAQFRDDHGIDPYIIAESTWRLAADGNFLDGGALAGPTLSDLTVVGPGFDDTRLGSSGHPWRDREGGRFYEWSFREALGTSGSLLLIDSWNGMHDGTAICATREFGSRFIDLTRTWIRRFKLGTAVGDEIELEHEHPRPRPDWFWGKTARGAPQLELDAADEGATVGLSVVEPPDGPVRRIEVAGDACLATLGVRRGVSRYMYFRVSDYFVFDEPCEIEIEIRYHDSGAGSFELHYDSTRTGGSKRGAYQNAGKRFRGGEDRWRTTVFRLPDARFAGRQNGDADFRLSATGTDLLVASVRLRRRDG